MMNKIWLGLIVLVVLLAAWFMYFGQDLNLETDYSAPALESTPSAEEAAPQDYTVRITASGYEPETIHVNKGDSVTWINQTQIPNWPASAIHPTHSVYPEPGGCIGSKFDACKGLKFEETHTFVFNNAGAWNYHDHLNPALKGTVEVLDDEEF